MTRYHISANGTPAVCKAEKGACPLGADTTHYEGDSIQDVQRQYEEDNINAILDSIDNGRAAKEMAAFKAALADTGLDYNSPEYRGESVEGLRGAVERAEKEHGKSSSEYAEAVRRFDAARKRAIMSGKLQNTWKTFSEFNSSTKEKMGPGAKAIQEELMENKEPGSHLSNRLFRNKIAQEIQRKMEKEGKVSDPNVQIKVGVDKPSQRQGLDSTVVVSGYVSGTTKYGAMTPKINYSPDSPNEPTVELKPEPRMRSRFNRIGAGLNRVYGHYGTDVRSPIIPETQLHYAGSSEYRDNAAEELRRHNRGRSDDFAKKVASGEIDSAIKKVRDAESAASWDSREERELKSFAQKVKLDNPDKKKADGMVSEFMEGRKSRTAELDSKLSEPVTTQQRYDQGIKSISERVLDLSRGSTEREFEARFAREKSKYDQAFSQAVPESEKGSYTTRSIPDLIY